MCISISAMGIQKTESKAEITKTKLALEQEKTKAEVGTQAALMQRLQEQNETLQSRMDSMERDTRAIQQAAYERQDRARMALSIAMSYMTTLTGHINNRQPPPAPPMPTGLEGYIASLLQWSQEIPKQDNPENLATLPPPDSTEPTLHMLETCAGSTYQKTKKGGAQWQQHSLYQIPTS